MTQFPPALAHPHGETIMTALGRAAASVLAYALAVAVAAAFILPHVVAPLSLQDLQPASGPVVARTPPPFQPSPEVRP